MKTVRLGIVGLGMGALHAANVQSGKVRRAVVTAVADNNPEKFSRAPGARAFATAEELIGSGLVDAVLIATPHYSHTSLGIKALRAGLHVLVEKPISVQLADAQRLLAAHRGKKQVFAAMFNQRTDPFYQKIRALVRGGELGEFHRISWTVTDWFRPAAYYASSAWRATWAGEGGGILLNQCPHNLDLLQWMFGMPVRLRAYCHFGRYHDIEVEDDVTAYLEFANGATGVFTASTGEAPGTNRLEVAAERGRLVYENDRLTFTRNAVPAAEFSRTTKEPFAKPATDEVVFPLTGHGGQHAELLQNFIDAILDGTPLLAPASEGLHSVGLANAMLLSTWTDRTVSLPISGRAYAGWLKKKIATSKRKPRTKSGVTAADLAKSFGR